MKISLFSRKYDKAVQTFNLKNIDLFLKEKNTHLKRYVFFNP